MSQTWMTTVAAGFALAVAAAPGWGSSVLWGVTNGTGDSGWWTGGEIFTVDTGTGAVSVKATYPQSTLLAFGDIAVTLTGDVYVTYYGDNGFDKLAKVNTATWGFDWVQDLGGWNDQVNALEFLGGTLYGVTGGGIPADLLQFSLTGAGATVTNLGNIGINSDGDLAQNPADGTVYYTSWETGNTSELNVVQFGPPPAKTGKEIGTLSGWSGMAFADGELFAGTYWNQNLYTLDFGTANPSHTATLKWDLSGSLGGTITGLSYAVPEPLTLLAIGLSVTGLGAYVRRRIH